MSELITKLNPARVIEAMQAPSIIYESDSIESLENLFYKSHTYDPHSKVGIIILPSSEVPGSSGNTTGVFYHSKFTKVTIGNGVTSIGNWAFSNCYSLTSVTIGNSVTSIGNNTFYNCTSLASITIDNGVTSIKAWAFDKCSSLTNITIPNSVTSIEGKAFEHCSSLKSVTIGNSVRSVGNWVFIGCSSLTSVYCKPTTPPTGSFAMFSYSDEENRPIGCKIYVPRDSVEAYKSAKYWSDYADQIVGVVFEDEVLESGKNIKTIGGQSLLGEGDISFVQPITYLELRELCEHSKLIPGQMYRIIDYKTTTAQEYTSVANHQFDLIVQAIDTRTISPDAKAVKHAGTSYFTDEELNKWEIKYDVRNNPQQYEWSLEDPIHTVTSEAGTVSTGILSLAYNEKIMVDGQPKYLYHPNLIRSYLNGDDSGVMHTLYYYEDSEEVSIHEVSLVSEINYWDDVYSELTIYAMKDDGTIVHQWNPDESYSETSVYVCVQEYDERVILSLTGETVEINGNTYYTWTGSEDAYAMLNGDLHTSPRVYYEGDGSSLYYMFDEPLYLSDQSYSLPVKQVYDADTDIVYINFAEAGEDMDDTAYDSLTYFDTITYSPAPISDGKGVIYYLKDNNGNEAPFDFKNILTNSYYTFYHDNNDASRTIHKNNKIEVSTSKLPKIYFDTSVCSNNTVKVLENNLYYYGLRYKLQDCSGIFNISKDTQQVSWTYSPTLQNCNITFNGVGSLDNDNCTYKNCNFILGDGDLRTPTSGSYSILDSTFKLGNKSVEYRPEHNTTLYNLNMDMTRFTSYGASVSLKNYTSTIDKTITITGESSTINVYEGPRKFSRYSFTGSTITLYPGKYYRQTTPTETLTIYTSTTANTGQEFWCEFKTATTGTTVILPAWLQWESGIPTFDPDAVYVISIMGDMATCKTFNYDPDSCKIQYLTYNGSTISYLSNWVSNASLVSNTYDGMGVGLFNKPVTTVSDSSSSNLANITHLIFSNATTSITLSRLSSYTRLTDITLGNNMKSISSFTSGPDSLKIHVPNLKSWLQADVSSNAFKTGQQLYVNGELLEGSLTIPTDVTRVGTYNLAGYSYLTDIIIPKHVENLGNYSIYNFEGNLTIASQNVLNTIYDKKSIYSCNVNTLTIQSPITKLPSYFTQTLSKGSITEVVLPGSLTSIQSSAFYNTSIQTLTIPSLSNVVSVDSSAFNWDKVQRIKLQHSSSWFKFQRGDDSMIWRNKDIQIVNDSGNLITELSCDISTIPMYTLYGHTQFKKVNASYATCIEKYAFAHSKVNTVIVGSNLKTIETEAFANSSLTSITLPYGLTTIGSSAFYYTPMSTVTIPQTVTSIGPNAFYFKNSGGTIYCNALTPPTLTSWITNYNTKIYVPSQALALYKTADVWKDRASYIYGRAYTPLIAFEVDGISYTAEDGMTWEEWVNSNYNTGSFHVGGEYVYSDEEDSWTISQSVCETYGDEEDNWEECWDEPVSPSDTIIANEYYNYY